MMGQEMDMGREPMMVMEEVGMAKEVMVVEPAGVEVERPRVEMAEPVRVEVMAEAELRSDCAMMAKAVPEAEVATTPMAVMAPVMPHRLGRQCDPSEDKTPDEEGECNSSHPPWPPWLAHYQPSTSVVRPTEKAKTPSPGSTAPKTKGVSVFGATRAYADGRPGVTIPDPVY